MKTVSLHAVPDKPDFEVVVHDSESASGKTWCTYKSKAWAMRAVRALERQGYVVVKDAPAEAPKFSREDRPLTARPSRAGDLSRLQLYGDFEPRAEYNPFGGLFSDPEKFEG